jgi:glycosyltransferase involved in cell wall biosynthesis
LLSLAAMMNVPALAAKTLARNETRLVISEHANLSVDLRSEHRYTLRMRALPIMIRMLYGRADGLVAVSRRILDDPVLGRSLRAPDIPTAVIANPVTWDVRHQASSGVAHEWLAEDRRAPTFVTAGRLVEQKGIDLTISAIAILRQRGIDCRLIVLGEGSARDSLQELARKLGVADCVAMPGFASNPFPTLGRCAAYLLGSRSEGSPLSILEAMALGRPIVATAASGAMYEVIEDGITGIVVPDGDAFAMAGAMQRLIENATFAHRLGQRAAESAYSAHSPFCVTERYLDFFQRVLEAR